MINDVPLDALVAEFGSSRHAIYKMMFDARRKLRGALTARTEAEERDPGIAAHLRACGPCSEDFEALLAAVRDIAP